MECLLDFLVEEVFECDSIGKRIVRCESICYGRFVEDKFLKGGDFVCSCWMDYFRVLKN